MVLPVNGLDFDEDDEEVLRTLLEPEPDLSFVSQLTSVQPMSGPGPSAHMFYLDFITTSNA